jgi:large subunit ribosomal protein L9e
MRMVYAHFPINCLISKDKTQVEVKNFLGGKEGHLIQLPKGVTAVLSNKDELTLEGNSNADISLSCARICQVCKIGTKDERKFLDGIFVSETSTIEPRDE